jgi:hypothetical protein
MFALLFLGVIYLERKYRYLGRRRSELLREIRTISTECESKLKYTKSDTILNLDRDYISDSFN